MVWAHYTLRRTCKDNPARSSPGVEKTRQTEEESILEWTGKSFAVTQPTITSFFHHAATYDPGGLQHQYQHRPI